jgi:hemin uptake protein HemP
VDQLVHLASTNESPRTKPDPDTPSIDSFRLLNGRRELLIRHGVSTYRLRVTHSDKLILTK